jgi:hypothetical protein
MEEIGAGALPRDHGQGRFVAETKGLTSSSPASATAFAKDLDGGDRLPAVEHIPRALAALEPGNRVSVIGTTGRYFLVCLRPSGLSLISRRVERIAGEFALTVASVLLAANSRSRLFN